MYVQEWDDSDPDDYGHVIYLIPDIVGNIVNESNYLDPIEMPQLHIKNGDLDMWFLYDAFCLQYYINGVDVGCSQFKSLDDKFSIFNDFQ